MNDPGSLSRRLVFVCVGVLALQGCGRSHDFEAARADGTRPDWSLEDRQPWQAEDEPGPLPDAPATGCVGDLDRDLDGLSDCEEAEANSNPYNPDTDGDGLGDFEEVRELGTDPSKADGDDDGLSDPNELEIYGTDPNDRDSDGDGLSDGDEVLTHRSEPLEVDSDGDGLDDLEEVVAGSNPNRADSDGDGLGDAREVQELGTDPNVADSDGDGLSDFEEIEDHATNPLLADSDGDGLTDRDEVRDLGTDPNLADTDGDGLNDGFEVEESLTDPRLPDSDFDGLSDSVEFAIYGTDPNNIDSDGDGLEDGFEVLRDGTDPLEADSDGDGLLDGAEVYKYGSDPGVIDSDGDGLDDGDEVAFGLDPSKASSLDDGVQDSQRGFVQTCLDAALAGRSSHSDMAGDWTVYLRDGVTGYLSHASTSPDAALKSLATFQSGGPEVVAGFIAASSRPASLDALGRPVHVARFTTRDGFPATTSVFHYKSANPSTAQQLRDLLIYATTDEPVGTLQPDLSGGGGGVSDEFVVRFLDIERGVDDHIYRLGVSRATDYFENESVHVLVHDFASSGSVGMKEASTPAVKCDNFQGLTQAPRAELHWVLDQTGEISEELARIQQNPGVYLGRLRESMLHWRVGVTNMAPEFAGRLRASTGWISDPGADVSFGNEIQFYAIDCVRNFGFFGCSGQTEHGLYAGYAGLDSMTSVMSPANARVRSGAAIGTLFFTNENAQAIKSLSTPDGLTYMNQDDAIARIGARYGGRTTVFGAVSDGVMCGENAFAYREVTYQTAGVTVSLCESAETIEDWYGEYIARLSGEASPYRLRGRPILESMRVFVAGQEVSRGRLDGYTYDARTNTISFFGAARPAFGGGAGDEVLVLYEEF